MNLTSKEYFRTHPTYNWYGLKRIDFAYGVGIVDHINGNGKYEMGWIAELPLCIFLHKLNKFLRGEKVD